MKNIIKFKRLVLLAVISCLILPAISFALVRGQDGYNYYDNNSPPVGAVYLEEAVLAAVHIVSAVRVTPLSAVLLTFFLV